MARAVIGALRVVLGLDSAQFESGIKRTQRNLGSFEKSVGSLSVAVRAFGAALGIVSVGAAARGFVSLADQSARLTAQLRLATAQTGSFAKATEDVRRIAATTRTGLVETADLYATIQRNARELGVTQEQTARTTETITKAFRISGATAAESAGGLRQFLQGLQSGTLRGEELNSVLENAPRLARALADGLGVTIGQLRAMGEAGQLTGQEVLRALEGAAEGIDREFSELPITFDEAMTTLHNSAVITFGGFDRGGQFSTSLANFITQGTGGFSDLENRAEEMGRDVRSSIEGIYGVFEPLLIEAQSIFGQIGDESRTLAKTISDNLREIDAATNWLSRQGALGSALTGNTAVDWWNGTSTGTNLAGRFDASQQAAERRLLNQRADQGFRDLNRGRDVFGNRLDSGSVSRGGSAGGAGKKGPKGPSAETLARRAEAEQRRIEAEARRAAETLRRFTDDLERLSIDYKTAQADLNGGIEERAEAEKARIESDYQADLRAIEAREGLTEEQRRELRMMTQLNASAEREMVEQRKQEDLTALQTRMEQDKADLAIELAGISADLSRTATDRRAAELRILDLVFAEERARLELLANSKDLAEATAARARLDALPTIEAGARQTAINRTQGPLEEYLSRIPRDANEAREALERVQVDGIDGLVNGLADAAAGAKNLGDVFKSVAQQIIADLIRIQLRKALAGVFSSILGGAGNLAAGAGSASSGFGAILNTSSGSSVPIIPFGGFRAGGGPVLAGRAYMVGEHGPEMFEPSGSGQIVSNDNLGGTSVQVIPSPYFNVVVDGRVMQAAPAIMQGGAQVAQSQIAYRNTRRVA